MDTNKRSRAMLMDEEFLALETKLKEAVALLKECNDIAIKKGVTLRNTGWVSEGGSLIETYSLLDEIEKGGWRTSSLSC